MGFFTSTLTKLSKVSIAVLLIAVIPGIPPDVDFEAYSVTPSLPLEGALAINTRLNGAERLLLGQLHGPEGLAVHDGKIYTSVHGGKVVRINGDKIEHVAKFGQPCEGFHEEEKCGRPLGLDFDKKGKLYVADAYYGIFKVDPSSGKYENLVSINEVIDGKAPKLPNSVAVSSDGYVYWTDSSTTHQIQNGLFVSLMNASGRLIRYDPNTKTNKVLLDTLHFPNGVVLSKDESFLVFGETVTLRLIKYHLKGVNAGKREIFLDGLPGMPDNIHSDGQGGFTVGLVDTRDQERQSLLVRLAPYPLVRKLIARLLYLNKLAVTFLRDLYPIDVLKKGAHIIGHFEMVPSAMKMKRATVLFVTNEGKISRSLHATDGLTGVCGLIQHDGYYYLSSPFNHFLARVKAN